jgi:hypothetical protein
MWWILVIVRQAILVITGIRNEQRAGLWSWSKFVFALGFAGLECIILLVPIHTLDIKGRWFIPVFSAAGVLAALNFIWMIIVARRWKLPDGRTSLQAYRDQHPKK